jgi:hypothetical protein
LHSISSLSRVLSLAVATGAVCAFARPLPEPDFQAALRNAPLVAQASPSPDPYGIDAPSTPSTTPAAPADTTPAVTPPPATPPTAAPADTAPRAPRPRITRETTINPMDVKKGSYRNPKKALFMSLVVPGLGQAYIGQSAFTYARGAAYFATDVTLGLLWYNFSVVKYDKQVKTYRAYADEHWNQRAYEDSVSQFSSGNVDQFLFDRFNPARGTYCAAVQEGTSSSTAAKFLKACQTPYDDQVINDYDAFRNSIGSDPAAGRSARRAAFPDPVSFYEAIGANKEFIFGWDDAAGAGYDFSDSSIAGTSAHRDVYNGMRQKAKDYSRMQTWFIGGIVLNHIASAVDAALTARRHNRVLYQGEARWYDRVNLDGGMAFDEGRPRTQLTASLTF